MISFADPSKHPLPPFHLPHWLPASWSSVMDKILWKASTHWHIHSDCTHIYLKLSDLIYLPSAQIKVDLFWFSLVGFVFLGSFIIILVGSSHVLASPLFGIYCVVIPYSFLPNEFFCKSFFQVLSWLSTSQPWPSVGFPSSSRRFQRWNIITVHVHNKRWKIMTVHFHKSFQRWNIMTVHVQ